MQEISNKYALVTGASSGIGKDMAEILASRGNNLILTARSHERLNQFAKELTEKYKVDVRVVVLDLAKPNSPLQLYNKIKEQTC